MRQCNATSARRPSRCGRTQVQFRCYGFLPPSLPLPPSPDARRERERLDPRAAIHRPTGHWTFLSSFPPLDVGQASGGRVEGRSPPARASNSGVQISSSAFRVRIISSIVCLHWKLRGANALICVREMEASSALALALAMAGAWARLLDGLKWIFLSHRSQ